MNSHRCSPGLCSGLPFAALLASFASLPIEAQETSPAPAPVGPILELEPMRVVGSTDALLAIPGAGAFLAGPELRDSGNLTFGRLTARVPGLYVREEDGYGNFINVSIRGVDGTRSRKVTLMEDGILTAPSPYAAPDAYYSPKMGRMAGIEILKGSSQVANGPHTTGGVINFLSTGIPEARTLFSRTTVGTDATFFNHTTFGETVRTDFGAVGVLLEFHGQVTDGYRKVDGSSRDTGFTYLEPMLKLSWEPATSLAQRFEVKVGTTDFEANESYSGLAEGDLRANPDRRYASTAFDHMDATQWRSYLKYVVLPSEELRIETALYLNTFDRVWDKLDGLRGTGLRTNVAEALLHAPSLAVLQGLGTGEVFTRVGAREHDAHGWQSRVDHAFETGDLDHKLSVGLRLHEDSVDGSNQQVFYASNGTGGFGPASPGAVAPAGFSEVFATALFAEHVVEAGRFAVTSGLRHEWLDWTTIAANGTVTDGDAEFTTAGLGLTATIDEHNTAFVGLNRGVSVPNPGGYRDGAKHESSLGLEVGLRHHRGKLRGELVAFRTAFEDLIAPQVGIGSGGVTPSTNAGNAETQGVEALLELDLGRTADQAVGLSTYVSMTWTQAEFVDLPGNGRLGNGAGVFAGAANGNAIPYVPEWKLSAGAVFSGKAWALRLDGAWTSSTWGSGYNGSPRLQDGSGTLANPTSVDGRLDSLFVADITGHVDLNAHLRLIGGVQNAFDERGIISRLPLGPRAHAPRFAFIGAELRF